MKQKLINWFMILEPIISIVIFFMLFTYGECRLRISSSILVFSGGIFYITILKYTILIILLITLLRAIFKNKVLRFRYFVYAFVCIIQLLPIIFLQLLFSWTAYDTSLGVIGTSHSTSSEKQIEYYCFYENYDVESICTREKEIIDYIPEDKIIDNNGIIEYNFYDGNQTIIYKYEFKIELTYEEKLEYVNVFVNEIYSYDEKNLID